MGRLARGLKGDETSVRIRTVGGTHKILYGLMTQNGVGRWKDIGTFVSIDFGAEPIERVLTLGFIEKHLRTPDRSYPLFTLTGVGCLALEALEQVQPLGSINKRFGLGRRVLPSKFTYVHVDICISDYWWRYFQNVSW